MMLRDRDMPWHLIDGPILKGEVRNLTTTAQIRLAAVIDVAALGHRN